MSFLNKLKAGFMHFMSGRNGADQLGMCTLITALVLDLLDAFTGSAGILSLLGVALYAWTIFRMLSRNIYKRQAENAKFLEWYEKAKKFVLRYWTRLKNCREYKYFSCPQCKASIRMKRGMGEREITCPGCKHVFRQKS